MQQYLPLFYNFGTIVLLDIHIAHGLRGERV